VKETEEIEKKLLKKMREIYEKRERFMKKNMKVFREN
jgi:hypothetical protein